MTQVVAKVYGEVSIVNAIAIGKGSTLGIDTFVETTLTKKRWQRNSHYIREQDN